jgi:phenylacetate-CoA ligase
MRSVSFARRLGWAARLAIEAPRAGRLPFSRRRIERSAHRSLHGSIRHAYESVPHYRELFDDRGLKPSDFATAADLAALPILEREQLQSDPERFVSARTPRQSMVELKTGGSSGEPLAVYIDPGALIQGAAQRERRRRMFQRAAGRRLRLRSLTFGTEQSTGRTTAGAFSRHSLIPRGIRLVSTQASMLDPLEDNVRLIERLRPDVVGGYGSYLELLMDYIGDRGGTSHLPSLLAWGGDGMSERGRRTIPERFGVPTYGLYGAVEAFHIGFECGAHRGFHVNTDIHPVRPVDDDGGEVPEGGPDDLQRGASKIDGRRAKSVNCDLNSRPLAVRLR